MRRRLGLRDGESREDEDEEVGEGGGFFGLVYECRRDVPFKGSSEL